MAGQQFIQPCRIVSQALSFINLPGFIRQGQARNMACRVSLRTKGPTSHSARTSNSVHANTKPTRAPANPGIKFSQGTQHHQSFGTWHEHASFSPVWHP